MTPQTETKTGAGFKAGVKNYGLTYYTPDYVVRDTDQYIAYVAYPIDLFEEGSVTNMFTSIVGNVFGFKALRDLRLEDLRIPSAYIKTFAGPPHGIQVERDKLHKIGLVSLLVPLVMAQPVLASTIPTLFGEGIFATLGMLPGVPQGSEEKDNSPAGDEPSTPPSTPRPLVPPPLRRKVREPNDAPPPLVPINLFPAGIVVPELVPAAYFFVNPDGSGQIYPVRYQPNHWMTTKEVGLIVAQQTAENCAAVLDRDSFYASWSDVVRDHSILTGNAGAVLQQAAGGVYANAAKQAEFNEVYATYLEMTNVPR